MTLVIEKLTEKELRELAERQIYDDLREAMAEMEIDEVRRVTVYDGDITNVRAAVIRIAKRLNRKFSFKVKKGTNIGILRRVASS